MMGFEDGKKTREAYLIDLDDVGWDLVMEKMEWDGIGKF